MMGKDALSLLIEYGSDTSDDEVSGSRVSTKRTRYSDEETNYPKKKTEKLPLPENFRKTISLDMMKDDKPELHEGKIRSFPHERGNWATYVYIPFEPEKHMKVFISEVFQMLPESMNLNNIDEYHISLTKTVVLKYHWINSFIDNVKTNVSHIKKFMILFDSVKVYCNVERTRTFLGVQIRSGYDTLIKITEILDNCLEEFNLPQFYDDPSFHISIAWCVGDHQEAIEKYLPQINTQFFQFMSSFSHESWYILVDHLLCKTGNKYFQFNLS